MTIQLHETRIGQRFLEATAPKIAEQLEHLNTNLAALVTELRLQREARASTEATQPVEPK
jgi:hypothetical protein